MSFAAGMAACRVVVFVSDDGRMSPKAGASPVKAGTGGRYALALPGRSCRQ